jgi:hypothetical protein
MRTNDISEMSGVEYCARMIALFLKAAISEVDESFRVIEHECLNPRMIQEVGRFFGIEAASLDDLTSVLQKHSKLPNVSFSGDSREKLKRATSEIRELARIWTDGPYQQLKAIQK